MLRIEAYITDLKDAGLAEDQIINCLLEEPDWAECSATKLLALVHHVLKED